MISAENPWCVQLSEDRAHSSRSPEGVSLRCCRAGVEAKGDDWERSVPNQGVSVPPSAGAAEVHSV